MRRLPFLALLAAGCAAAVSDDSPAPVKPGAAPESLWTRKAGSDWPCFLGPTGDGVSSEKGLLTKWPAAGPKLVWEKETGTGYSAPSVSRGRLFIFDRQRNLARLRAWKAETGESLWTFDYPTTYRDKYGYNNGPRCCPVVEDDRVYIHGVEGMLHCVRATDGKMVWKVDTAADFGIVQNFFGVASTPVVEGDLLLVMVGGSPKESQAVAFDEVKPNGSALVAFDKLTGKVKWKVGDDLASYAGLTVRSFGKKRLCLAFCRGGLLGVDVTTGKQEFHYPYRSELFESVNASNPIVVDRKIFLSECYQLGSVMLDVVPGGVKEAWGDKEKPARRKSMMTHWMTPIHVDGYIYGSSGRHGNDAELRCIDAKTGKVMWSEPGLTRSSLTQIDGHFVCLGEDGWLRLLKIDPKKFNEVAKVMLTKDKVPLLEEPCWAAPVVSHGLMYLRGKDRVVCVEVVK